VLRQLTKSAFFRNFFTVLSGTAIAQAIGFALGPILSRLYSPEDFGVYGAFNALGNVLAAAITLEYSQAIILPKDRTESIHLLALSCLATLILSTGLCLVAILLRNFIKLPLPSTETWMILALGLSAAIAGLGASFQAWCVRSKDFKSTSHSQIIRSLMSNGLQTAIGPFQAGGNTLIACSLIGESCASGFLLRSGTAGLWKDLRGVQWPKLKQVAGQYKDFPLFAASQNALNAFSSGIPVLLLGGFYGGAVAGAYAFALRTLNAPMGLVLRPLRQVLLQKAAETQHSGVPLLPLYLKSTLALAGLAVLPAVLLFSLAPSVFAWFFGAEWREAGQFASWLVVWMTFAFCNLPAIIWARLIRLQHLIFLYDVILLLVRLGCIYFGQARLSALQTIRLFSVVSALMNFILICLIGLSVFRRDRQNAPKPRSV